MENDLFNSPRETPASSDAAPRPSWTTQPLAARMRPRSLSEIAGQKHLLGETALLPRLVRTNRIGSILLYGPPGCGKTSLAEAIAAETGSRLVRVNAVMSSTAELRGHLSLARARPELGTILFIDELHRFNKAQQDLLLPDVEEGHVRLIGATTHNPGFYVNPPLLSRSHLFRLEPVPKEEVRVILARALADRERGLGSLECTVDDGVLEDLAALCDGDLRRALNSLEVLALSLGQGGRLTKEALSSFAAERRIRYDADEDEHYDTASVFIKSIRGCDPDAALYWLGKMLAGGEDPRFIARRLVILASEDIGMADPRALPLAVAAHQACEFVGLPECEYNLVHAVIFLATCPKSNSAAEARTAMHAALRESQLQQVPLEFRDKSGAASRAAGHGKGYLYSHDYPEAISGQDYLEKPLTLYRPKEAGAESAVRERLERWRKLKWNRKSGQVDKQPTQ
jgi:putative ATPase